MTSKTKTHTACAMQIIKKLLVFLEHAALRGAVSRCNHTIVRATRGEVCWRHPRMGDAALRGPVCGYGRRRVTIESYKGTSAALTPWCRTGENGSFIREKATNVAKFAQTELVDEDNRVFIWLDTRGRLHSKPNRSRFARMSSHAVPPVPIGVPPHRNPRASV